MAELIFKSTFLEGKGNLRLIKKFRENGEKESYPNAKNFTSHVYQYPKSIKGLEMRLKDMQKHAESGGCMLKGELDKELKEEPRAGHTLRNKPNDVLVLDIDNLRVNLDEILGFREAEMQDAELMKKDKNAPSFIDTSKGKLGEHQIKAIAAHLVKKFPSEFHDISYFIHASSSMGTKGKDCVSMHLEFVLDNPVSPHAQKDWLMAYNLIAEPFKSNLSLGVTGLALKYPLDVTVADNSKLIFIGHPYFERSTMNPIEDEHRIILVKKKKVMLPSEAIRLNMSVAAVKAMKDTAILNLRKAQSLPKVKAETKTIVRNNERLELLKNPDAMTIEIVDEQGDFVHCNINGGDSNGYYFFKHDPSIVHNFKQEPVFRLQDANENFYYEMLERFADEISERKGRQYLVVRDSNNKGKINAVEIDANTKKIYYHSQFDDLKAATDWAAQYGELLPESLPFAFIDYNPTKSEVIERRKPSEGAAEEVYINTFQDSELWLRASSTIDTVPNYENCTKTLKDMCPASHFVMNHVLNGDTELRHFLNWIAMALQTKKKIGTTWLMQGVQGTGKGIMWEEVLRPLFGKNNTKKSTIDELEDRFDTQFTTKTLVLIDEFRHSEAKGSKRLESRLKIMATESEYSVRAMHKEYNESENFFNMIFYSNAGDAARIEESDRRWNVAPRQRISLRARLNPTDSEKAIEHIERLIEKIRGETETLANFFKSFEVNTAQARNALENQAKNDLRSASRTRTEDFTAAIYSGDAAWFYMNAETYSGENPKLRAELKKALEAIINRTDMEQNLTVVTLEDLAPFYSIIAGGDKLESVQAVRKYLMRHASDALLRKGTLTDMTEKRELGAREAFRIAFRVPDILRPEIEEFLKGQRPQSRAANVRNIHQ